MTFDERLRYYEEAKKKIPAGLTPQEYEKEINKLKKIFNI